MEAVLRGLEAVDGDLSDDQARFQAALARVEFDAPNGHVRLDGNRQLIGPNYIQRVTKSQNGLTWRTQQKLDDVEPTFNGYFRSSAPLGRETITCRRGDPPAWVRR